MDSSAYQWMLNDVFVSAINEKLQTQSSLTQVTICCTHQSWQQTQPIAIWKSSMPSFPKEKGLLDVTMIIQQSLQDIPLENHETSHPPQTISQMDTSMHAHLRINIIWHRFSRSTELTTLKLFKSFTSLLEKVDSPMQILPIDSMTQQFTAITTSDNFFRIN
jgi:hypothetical protein